MWISITNHVPDTRAHTTLKRICDEKGLPYRSALSGKKRFLIGNDLVEIEEVQIIRIKKSGNNSTFRRK